MTIKSLFPQPVQVGSCWILKWGSDARRCKTVQHQPCDLDSWLSPLQLERTQILPKIPAELLILKSNLDGSLQKSELVSRVIRLPFVNMCVKSGFLRQQPQAIGQLNFASLAGPGPFQTIENFRWQNVPPGNAQVGRRLRRARFLDQIANLLKPFTPP